MTQILIVVVLLREGKLKPVKRLPHDHTDHTDHTGNERKDWMEIKN